MKILSDDELRRLEASIPDAEEYTSKAESSVEGMSVEELVEWVSSYPDPPATPGLYALIAPDGVMVRVVDERTSRADLRSLVVEDIYRRMLRPVCAELVGEGKLFDEITGELTSRAVELKKQYHLDKLA
jgi:hypothetical protein